MRKLNILIADDNKHFINAFKFILFDSFPDKINKIFEAYNGQECLDILKQNSYMDIVFMDIDMPVLDGISATKIAVEEYRGIRIIAVSFHNEMHFISKMIEKGAINYLIKEEINKTNLRQIIEKII